MDRTLLATGTDFESTADIFLRIQSDFEVKWDLAEPREDKVWFLVHV